MSRVRPAVVAAVLLAVIGGLVGAPPASAGDKVLRGTLLGEDQRAVSALLGFDLKDGQGRTLGASGCVRSPSCPVEGYAVTRRVNFDLGAQGSSAEGWARTWTVSLPEETERVYIEVYPQGRRYAGTDMARYGASFRRNLEVPYDQRVNLRLPLVCGAVGDDDERGSTGFVNGYARDGDGDPVRLKRITAFSLEPDNNRPSPVLGFGVGTVESNGYYRVPNLASGTGRTGQRYQLIATAVDGRVRRVFDDVTVGDCGRVARNIVF